MKLIKHPTSNVLVSYLDGECDGETSREVQRHLQQCWKCRSEAAAIERTINRVVGEVQKPSWPSDDHQHLARQRLMARLHQERQGSQDDGAFLQKAIPQPGFFTFRVGASVSAALVLLTALVLGTGPFRNLVIPDTLAEIPQSRRTALSLQFATWEQAESLRRTATGAWSSSHEIRVSILDQPASSRRWMLESLNHGKARDYHLRMRPSQGRVQYAAWQPGPDPRFVYVYQQQRWGRLTQLSRGPASGLSAFAASTSGSDLSKFEGAVFQWVQAMVFHSHLPTRRFADLTALPGSTVSQSVWDDRPWVCVQYRQDRMAIDDCLEGNPVSGEVLREWIRIQSSEANGEGQTIHVQVDWAPALPVATSVLYETDFLPSGLRSLDLARARRRSPQPSHPVVVDDTQQHVLAAALDAEEAVLVLSAIEGPEFAVDLALASDAVIVQGRVATIEQYDTLRDAILPLTAHSPYLRYEVQVAENAPLPPLGDPARIRIGEDGDPLATAFLIANHPSLSKEELRDFCNRAIRLSGNVVSTARRMAAVQARYGPELLGKMAPSERRRLEDIRARNLRHYWLALADLHQFFVQSGLDSGKADTPAMPAGVESTSALYESARSLHAEMLKVFAVGDPGDASALKATETLASQVREMLRPASSAHSASQR